MSNKDSFINPLTRSSEKELHIPNSTKENHPHRDDEQIPPTNNQYQPLRKRKGQTFEKTNQRFTGWIDNNLKQRFEKLAIEEGVSKTSLLNEALADLLKKHMQKYNYEVAFITNVYVYVDVLITFFYDFSLYDEGLTNDDLLLYFKTRP